MTDGDENKATSPKAISENGETLEQRVTRLEAALYEAREVMDKTYQFATKMDREYLEHLKKMQKNIATTRELVLYLCDASLKQHAVLFPETSREFRERLAFLMPSPDKIV